jgi:hypothetical protein
VLPRLRTTVTLTAWAAFVLSWFLPTVHVKPGGLFGDIDAGWKAFMLAFSMALKPDRFDWFWGLCIAGVLGNVLVILTPWLFRRWPAAPFWLIASLAAAFALNLCWIAVMSDTVLLTGYWLWIGSIGALASAAALHHRRATAS